MSFWSFFADCAILPIMRFPFNLTYALSRYIFKMKRAGMKRFPLVLMLEPLHACNLKCSGCGRIREYAQTLNQRMSLKDCLESVDQCPAPIVSVCGGEPLIYPEIIELVKAVLDRGKFIYFCTNGVLLAEKLTLFDQLFEEPKYKKLKSRLFWNVHLDGPESVHDLIVEQPGVFQKALRGITLAKERGYLVYTNTTLYKETTVEQLIDLAETLKKVKINGIMLAPGFGYESVENADLFLSREEVHNRFREIRSKMRGYRITTSPIFMDFLCGEHSLDCAAFANPTRNIAGWKGPCYLLTDRHYESFEELYEQTDWDKTGPGHDPRCEHCLSHCGFEPAAVFASNSLKTLIRMGIWQLG
ncbi:MAG: adenosyl-hopene transferase HpnH [Thermoguttaceae bacterium]